MEVEGHDFIDVEEAEFLAWIREFENASGEDFLLEERWGIESGPHGE